MLWTIPALLLFVSTGCGAGATENVPQADANVRGKVTFQNRPISSAAIVFYSPESKIGNECILDSKGEFQLSSLVPPGNYVIYIHQDGKAKSGIPARYQSESTSEHLVQVNAGENDLKIELKE